MWSRDMPLRCQPLNVTKQTALHSACCQFPIPLQLDAAPLLSVCVVSTDDKAESNQSLRSPLITVGKVALLLMAPSS